MAFDSAPTTFGKRPGDEKFPVRCEIMRKRHSRMWAKKDTWSQYWQKIAEIFYPERAQFTQESSQALEQHDHLYTMTPQLLRRDLSARLGSMVRARGRNWFELKAKPVDLNDDDAVREWCRDSTQIMRDVIYDNGANFTMAMAESDNDFVAFGNSLVYHATNRARDGMAFRCVHLKDAVWRFGAEGELLEVHERLKLPLGVIARQFGIEALPRSWRELLNDPSKDGDLLEKTIVCAVCTPEGLPYSAGHKPLKSKELVALYFALDSGLEEGEGSLGEGSYSSWPYTVRRWMSVSGEDFARSPCTAVALCDGRTLNSVEASLLKSVEHKVSPPRWALDEAVVGEMSLRANSVTYVDGEMIANAKDPFGVFETGDPKYGMDLAQWKELQLRQAFFDHILRKLPEKVMTATEAAEWIETYVQDATPLFEPMEADNAHICDAVFDRIMSNGVFLPLPEALQGADVDWEFETPLSIAMRKQKTQQFRDMVSLVAEEALVNPKAGENVDWDEAERAAIAGINQDWVKNEEDRDAQRAALQAQQAQEQENAEIMGGLEVAARANPENLRMIEEKAGEAGIT